MPRQYNNFTIDECKKTVAPLVANGARFHMKFTCAKCWARVTCKEANKFFEIARCDRCGHFTNVKRDGCNYSLVIPIAD